MSRFALAALLLAASATAVGCMSPHDARPATEASATPSIGGTSTPAVFYASIGPKKGAVYAVSTETGSPLEEIAPAQRGGMTVAGVSSAGPDDLLVTYARGPQCSSGVAGCGPRPNTCGAEVVHVDTRTKASDVQWHVGSDTLLRGASLSPDGTMIAALEAPCMPSYFNDHLAVLRLTDQVSWRIGAAVARCHFLGAPHWFADSRRVVTAYAAPTGKRPYAGSDGTCTSVEDNSLVVLDATREAGQITGERVAPAPSCTWQAVATTATRIVTVEACGSGDQRVDGDANLVELDDQLTVLRRTRIGECTDGNSVAADDERGILVSAYLYCASPRSGESVEEPQTVLDSFLNGDLRAVARTEGGYLGWDDLAW